jgi:hypothetical protein
VEPGIFSTFPVRYPFAPENREANQSLESQFLQPPEMGILAAESGTKRAEPGIK